MEEKALELLDSPISNTVRVAALLMAASISEPRGGSHQIHDRTSSSGEEKRRDPQTSELVKKSVYSTGLMTALPRAIAEALVAPESYEGYQAWAFRLAFGLLTCEAKLIPLLLTALPLAAHQATR